MWALLLSCIYTLVIAQSTQSFSDSTSVFLKDSLARNLKEVIIGDINISGNKKTKGYIILREITFKKGQRLSIDDLEKKLTESRQLIYNTQLFVDDSVYVSGKTDNTVQINIHVKERWYFLPLPYFRLVDRNFNEWWVKQNRSLERVNYGIKLVHNNFTGQNDKLNLWFITGYNHQITARYDLPFIDKKLKQGINIGFTYASQHELNYATSLDNKQLFIKDNNKYLRTVSRFDITYSYRPDQYQRHYFRIAYTSDHIEDTVAKVNPAFFSNTSTNAQYFDFAYVYRYLKADYNIYPRNGFLFEGSVYKRGLSNTNNLWQLTAHTLVAKPLFNKTFVVIDGAATIKFPQNNYFYSQALLGYGNFQMRGLEYYVVDGMSGAIGRFAVHREIYKHIFKNPIKSKTHDKIPLRLYVKAFSDVGYINNPYVSNNLLNNKFLYTYGAGIDIVSFYDFVFRIDYSFNQLGNKGLYLHARSDF